jgi:peptidoglycan-associated lipoprotein
MTTPQPTFFGAAPESACASNASDLRSSLAEAAKPASLSVRAAAEPPTAPAAGPTASTGRPEITKALEELRGVSVFFKFDDATLSPEAEQRLADISAIQAKYPALKIEVDGNADERGSEQYNIALAQRRADSAEHYLIQMGARADQVATVS